jgi:hypothetical protein
MLKKITLFLRCAEKNVTPAPCLVLAFNSIFMHIHDHLIRTSIRSGPGLNLSFRLGLIAKISLVINRKVSVYVFDTRSCTSSKVLAAAEVICNQGYLFDICWKWTRLYLNLCNFVGCDRHGKDIFWAVDVVVNIFISVDEKSHFGEARK